MYSENVIDSLRISGDAPYHISIEACYGVNGAFICAGVEVLYVSTSQ